MRLATRQFPSACNYGEMPVPCMLLILLNLAGHGQLLRKEELLFRVPGLLPPFFFVWLALLPLLRCFAAKFAGALRREKNDDPALMAYPSIILRPVISSNGRFGIVSCDVSGRRLRDIKC